MISSLRRRHRQIFLVFAVFLPAILISGLIARRSIRVVDEIPGRITPSADRSDLIAWNEAGLRLGSGADALDVVPMVATAAPDLLLYWCARQPDAGELDGAAVMLGPLDGVRGQRFSLPSPVREADGYLIVWSQAHRRIIAARPWPKGGGR